MIQQCEVCGNHYDGSFDVILAGQRHTFDCFECAIHKLAPTCEHCGCKVIGHGVQAEGKRIAIFIENLYEDLEFWYPYYRMKEEGAEVIVVGPEKGNFTGKKGLPVFCKAIIEALR